MAADGLVTNGNELAIEFSDVKIIQLKDGSILGRAGAYHALESLRSFLDGETEEVESAGEWSALRLMPDGIGLYYCEHHPTLGTPASWPATLGTGGELALGAMLAGATPEEAVVIAAQRDVTTGGKITVLTRIEEMKT